MNSNSTILIAEDDEGHATLIMKNLRRAGIRNQILLFRDGDEILRFLFRTSENKRESGSSYLLLLDIRMPKIDGVEVLRRIKSDPELKKMPVIILTTTDDPLEVELCHVCGCNNYITKPVEYEKFVQTVQNLGAFMGILQIPDINGIETVCVR
ncbi:MAG: response regulator [Desulfococcaceae bacterium]